MSTFVSLSFAAETSLSKAGIVLTITESNKTSSAGATEQGCKDDGNVEDISILPLQLLGRDKNFDTFLSLDRFSLGPRLIEDANLFPFKKENCI